MAEPSTASRARAGMRIRLAAPTDRFTCRRMASFCPRAEYWESLGVSTSPKALRKAVGSKSMGSVMPKVTP